MIDKIGLKGLFRLVHKDPFGKVLSDEVFRNIITDQGYDYLLNVAMHSQTSIATWYFAIFTSGSANVLHTYAAPARTETTNYSETYRQQWIEGASSGQSITNAAPATITAGVGGIAVAGVGLVGSPSGSVGAATKGNIAATDGILFSDLNGTKTLVESETLDIYYTLSN